MELASPAKTPDVQHQSADDWIETLADGSIETPALNRDQAIEQAVARRELRQLKHRLLDAVDDEEEHMLESEEEGDSLNEINNLLTPVADLAALRELPKALKKKLGSKEQDVHNLTQKYCAGGAGHGGSSPSKGGSSSPKKKTKNSGVTCCDRHKVAVETGKLNFGRCMRALTGKPAGVLSAKRLARALWRFGLETITDDEAGEIIWEVDDGLGNGRVHGEGKLVARDLGRIYSLATHDSMNQSVHAGHEPRRLFNVIEFATFASAPSGFSTIAANASGGMDASLKPGPAAGLAELQRRIHLTPGDALLLLTVRYGGYAKIPAGMFEFIEHIEATSQTLTFTHFVSSPLSLKPAAGVVFGGGATF